MKSIRVTAVNGETIEQHMIDRAGNAYSRVAGWCTVHDDLAWRYDDGSIGCHHMAVLRVAACDDCAWISLNERMAQP